MASVEEFAQEYSSSLADLTFNSKPLINMLTTVAEENMDKAKVVVDAIEAHLAKVSADVKLPILYLIDCIVKNVGQDYTALFSMNIVSTFCTVFKVVDEKTRAEMFKLRQTWNDVFPQTKLFAIDVQIRLLDPAWPVTAQPTSSIHLNPKFLRTNTIKSTTAKQKPVTETVVSMPNPTPTSDIDKETLKMQEELIKKQKELLELQRKTLELEMFQTQVKLQEQMKSGGAPVSKNILMKPEVAKNLLPEMLSKRSSGNGTSIMNQRMQANQGSPPVKINPVNPALAHARPIRDPRLRRQQEAQQQRQREPIPSRSKNEIQRLRELSQPSKDVSQPPKDISQPPKDVLHQSKDVPQAPNNVSQPPKNVNQPSRDVSQPPKNVNQPSRDVSQPIVKSKSANFENNKHLSSKGMRGTIKDPRLSKKMEKPPKAPKISLIRPVQTAPPASEPLSPPKSSSNSQVIDMDIESNDVTSSKLSTTDSSSPRLSSFGSSSPRLSSLGGSSPRLGSTSSSATSLISSPSKSDKLKSVKGNSPKELSKSEDNITTSSDTTFKRKSKKNRNYMRHNRSPTPDTTPQDEDLRALPPPDKQSRMDVDEKVPDPVPMELSPKNMDVDLRQIPAAINKKRPSTEGPEPASKKSKTFDILFGNEDTDLRQLPPVIATSEKSDVIRPKTPPPPVISKEKDKMVPTKGAKQSHFDAIRAKLANATASANRDKVLSKSYNKKKLQATQDQDLRVNAVNPGVIISPEDAKSIQSGTMTKEQQQLLMNKIFMQIEKNKLLEAKKKDHEDSLNASLQPISDDELEIEDISPNPRDSSLFERRIKKPGVTSSPNKDKDERIVTIPAHVTNKVEESPGNISPRTHFTENASPRTHFTENASPQPQFTGNSSPQAQFNDKDERLILAPHVQANRQPANEHISHNLHRNMDNFPRNIPPPHMDQNLPLPFYPRGDIRQRLPFRGAPPPGQWRGRGVQQMFPQRPMRPWMQPNQQQPNWRNQGPRGFSPHMQEYPNQGSPNQMPYPDEDPIHEEPEDLVVSIMDDIKTINIDNMPREIRTYGDTAIIFMNWDDPREISFQSGSRRVILNNNEAYILNFGDDYKECLVGQKKYLIKLGVPTREIFINELGYECFFGGAPVIIDLDDNTSLTVQLDGPNPHVKISEDKRTDLVLGKVNLILNAKSVVPVFLDAKVQKFVIDGKAVTLKFVDGLKTCLINEYPFKVEFGGLPKPFFIYGKKHFIRFSVLPKGVRPGQVKIKDMDGEDPSIDKPKENVESRVAPEVFESTDSNGALTGQESPDNRSKSPNFFQNLTLPNLNTFDVISNALATSMTPTTPAASSAGNYEVENKPAPDPAENKPAPVLPIPVNINDLFQKLVASGFVQANIVEAAAKPEPVPKVEEPKPIINDPPKPVKTMNKPSGNNTFSNHGNENGRLLFSRLRPIDFRRPETLKVRQHGLYVSLYSGLQCSSCGMRFAPEATTLYSQHLDWHFRQNRKGKNKVRVASSRRWYYSLADWKNYEEIEDLEEREKNYFDQQQQETQADEGEEETEVPSVPADAGSTSERCEVCKDTFEQFFNEESEGWHLRNAIKVDEKNYHPVCYEDFQQSILESSMDETKPTENKLIPGLEIIVDDDDEEYEPKSPTEVVSLPSESEDASILEELIENDEELKELEDDGDDDDVILNEVAPINIVVDDDDDDENIEVHSKTEKFEKIKNEQKAAMEDDGFMEVGQVVSVTKGEHIKIKAEPGVKEESIPELELEPTESASLEIQGEEESSNIEEDIQAAHTEIITSIDGNIELAHNVPVTAPSSVVSGNRIKINISKPLPVITQSSNSSDNADDSLSIEVKELPFEEPQITHLKPALENIDLVKMPPVEKGTELTGLCSIM